jgi:acetyl esterase
MAGNELDAKLQAVVDAIGDMMRIDLDSLPLEEALRRARPNPASAPAPANSEDRTIPGFKGDDIRLRLYFPRTQPTKLPVLLHIHGGGFVAGSIGMDDARCSQIAKGADCIVASVEYRLAPEHAFPAGIEDSFAAWDWVTTHAKTFGGDSGKFAISGSSSGGHLAIGATLLARERGARMPCLQLLINPALDPSQSTASYREFSDGPFMTRARMAWFWKQYAGNGEPGGPLWAPLTADATGLPPALVITAEYDVLRDEGEAYAALLRAAGVEATVERYPGMIHGFLTMVPSHEASIAAMNSSVAALRKAYYRRDPM